MPPKYANKPKTGVAGSSRDSTGENTGDHFSRNNYGQSIVMIIFWRATPFRHPIMLRKIFIPNIIR